jgi:hypothetical protein
LDHELRTEALIRLAGVDILFMLLLAFSFYYLDPGSASYVTAQLTLVPTVLSFVAAAVVIGVFKHVGIGGIIKYAEAKATRSIVKIDANARNH